MIKFELGIPTTLPVENQGDKRVIVHGLGFPMKGEHFLSGAIPEVWLAPNSLSRLYYIVTICKDQS